MQNISAKLGTSGAALIVALAAGEASAQAPVYNWSGFYIGAHAGYGWGSVNAEGEKFNTKGFQAGLHAGYNWQLSSLVIGPEIDFGLSGVNGKEAFFADKDLSVHQRWYGSARLRVGLPLNGVGNGLLIYGTGGLAVAEWRSKIDFLGTDKDSVTHFGWIAGAGVEMPFGRNLSGRLEYLYADYGSKKHLGGGTIDPSVSTVRFGLSYKFATPAP